MSVSGEIPICDLAVEEQKRIILSFVQETTLAIANSLKKGDIPKLSILNKSSDKTTVVHLNQNNVNQFALYVKLLSIIQKLILNEIIVTKRDIYYQYKHFFSSQSILDTMVDNLARTIGVSRNALNIIATPQGLMAGDLELVLKDGSVINCSNVKYGTLIPNVFQQILEAKTSAKFVLIVEKEATFQRLINDNFLTKYPAILMTGKGVPDLNTRQLSHFLAANFDLKFLCLTDANPYGIQIMSIYKYGSISYKYNTNNLNIPNLKWIGLKMTDLNIVTESIRNECLIPLSKNDVQTAQNLIAKLQELKEFELINELTCMMENNCKAELQYLNNISYSFLCDVYLGAKISCYFT